MVNYLKAYPSLLDITVDHAPDKETDLAKHSVAAVIQSLFPNAPMVPYGERVAVEREVIELVIPKIDSPKGQLVKDRASAGCKDLGLVQAPRPEKFLVKGRGDGNYRCSNLSLRLTVCTNSLKNLDSDLPIRWNG